VKHGGIFAIFHPFWTGLLIWGEKITDFSAMGRLISVAKLIFPLIFHPWKVTLSK